MKTIRTFLHRWAAARIRRRAAAAQLALDEYTCMEQTRLGILANRAAWHDQQATPPPKARPVAPAGSKPKRWNTLQLVPKQEAAA